MRAARKDATALADFTVNLTDAATGVVVLTLEGAKTAVLIPADGSDFEGSWDVQWVPAGGQPVTLVQGEVTCTLDVTRP